MVGIIGLLLGIVFTVGFAAVYYSTNNNGAGMKQMMQMMRGDFSNMMNNDSSSLNSAEHLSHHEPTSCDATSCKVN